MRKEAFEFAWRNWINIRKNLSVQSASRRRFEPGTVLKAFMLEPTCFVNFQQLLMNKCKHFQFIYNYKTNKVFTLNCVNNVVIGSSHLKNKKTHECWNPSAMSKSWAKYTKHSGDAAEFQLATKQAIKQHKGRFTRGK
jgi:hypothetical protein